MNIFESLENLNVSEECFNDVMEIVEEIINELKNDTIGNAYIKRRDNYNNALNNAIKNPEDKESLSNYMKASNKFKRNSELSHKAFKRSGDIVSAQIASPKRHQENSDKAKSNYDTAKATEKEAVDNYNKQLHADRHYAGTISRALDAKSNPYRAELKGKAEEAQKNARQARKDYHDTLDRTNTVPRDVNYLKKHLEYQKTHDAQGNRK